MTIRVRSVCGLDFDFHIFYSAPGATNYNSLTPHECLIVIYRIYIIMATFSASEIISDS